MNSPASTSSQVHTKNSREGESRVSDSYAKECEEQREDFQQLMDEVGKSVSQYCQRRPGVAALTVFAVGFFFGWKIKPW